MIIYAMRVKYAYYIYIYIYPIESIKNNKEHNFLFILILGKLH